MLKILIILSILTLLLAKCSLDKSNTKLNNINTNNYYSISNKISIPDNTQYIFGFILVGIGSLVTKHKNV